MRSRNYWLDDLFRLNKGRFVGRIFLVAVFLAAQPAHASVPALSPPPEGIVKEARVIVDSMKRIERGPYSRIRWFCNDGTEHPPTPYPCAERGGGRQHAEYSGKRRWLAQQGWYVGTIFAALTWDALWQPETRNQRLRSIPLERYLEAVDDGWVLRRARHYRGRIQLEDEEATGRALLLELFEQPGFLSEHFLLARELARTVPHRVPGIDRTRMIRVLAQEIADTEESFTKLRVEIHSRPSASSAGKVTEWLESRENLSEEVHETARQLAEGLEALYGPVGRNDRLLAAAEALDQYSPAATRLIRESRDAPPSEHIALLARAIDDLRKDSGAHQPGASLRRLDLLRDLEAELRTSALERLDEPLTRRELLLLAEDLLAASWGLGLISGGEREALSDPIKALLTSGEVTATEYAFAARRLGLAGSWAAQTVRHTFAEALARYGALDPRAGRYVDELLRDSVLLPLGELSHRLAVDSARVTGIEHRVFGKTAEGLLGINPGVGRGLLRILEPQELARGERAAPDEITVLTETVPKLDPVAGILTSGEGNPLSHIQMLARNLGIPNVVVAPHLLSRLRVHERQDVLLAVAGDGRVLLERSRPAQEAVSRPVARSASLNKIRAPRPYLGLVRPLALKDLHAGLSGKFVGPKAANLGQLNRLFPDRIAPAIALPFGAFAQHTREPRNRLEQTFLRHHNGEIGQERFYAELEQVRESVARLSLKSYLVARLVPIMEDEFGTVGHYGLFIRSDTNAEDLPGFSGAGLNKTVPHAVGLESQLAAVTQVWSSVYTRRSMAWRSRILSNPEAVYSSVLLMKSVPSEKSGVLVTTDLINGGPGLTVSAAWGVGGAVDNESAESLILRPDGSTLLLAEAKAPYMRVLSPEGGISWLPATAGPILNDSEIEELRRLADDVRERYPPALDGDGEPLPFDIEYAFANGKLWLFQIRPLVQRGQAEADTVVNARIPPVTGSNSVSLDEPPRLDNGV